MRDCRGDLAADNSTGGETGKAPGRVGDTPIIDELGRLGGSGGLVAVGRDGTLALPFNCSGMYRGYVKPDGIVYTAIYDEAYRSA